MMRFILGYINMEENKENFRYFVRIANTDLDGNKRILSALTKIKGVSSMFANMMCNHANVDKSAKTGYLDDNAVKKLDEVLQNPLKFNAPDWMLNRRKNYGDGKDMHLVTGDLKFAKEKSSKKLSKLEKRPPKFSTSSPSVVWAVCRPTRNAPSSWRSSAKRKSRWPNCRTPSGRSSIRVSSCLIIKPKRLEARG